jgi:hypothetical protein
MNKMNGSRANDHSYETCQPCRPPKRHVGCRETCEGWKWREEQKQLRYAETLTAVRAIPDHEATKKGRNEALRRQKNGRNPVNR